jgi:uncharacterized damage-inducible protein DinB
MTIIDTRFPIGKVVREDPLTASRRQELIEQVAELPGQLRAVLEGIDDAGWEARYREGGWTVRQVVHHLADSHLNGYVRFRLALTEEVPTIKPYDQARWAELPDVSTTDPEVSLTLLEALHRRWVDLLRALEPEAFSREVYHPEQGRRMSLDEMLALYAWHGRHHTAHVVNALSRGGKAQ